MSVKSRNMRKIRSVKKKKKINVWRSYSDMMSGLLLLFVLIMALSLFQAQKNYDDKLEEQKQSSIVQGEYNDALTKQQQDIVDKEGTIQAQSEKLEELESTLAEKDASLNKLQEELTVKSQQLDEKDVALSTKEQELADKSSALDSKTQELEGKTQELNTKTEELDSKTQELQGSQEKIDKIIGVKADLIEELTNEFKSQNIGVSIDQGSGAMVLDSNVLFGFNDSDLTDEGKSVLDTVIPVYCGVLLSDTYRDSVAEITVDGYTDRKGTFEYNMGLSQKRSLSVGDYIIGIADDTYKDLLQEKLVVNGHSWNDPILNEDGSENEEASRRVEVRFRLRDEEILSELADALK